MNYILVNPKSKNGKNTDKINEIVNSYNGNCKKIDVLDDALYEETLHSLKEEDEIVLVGGDGTLNHFVNKVKDIKLPCNVYFYPIGTGNDFINDIKETMKEEKVLLNDYIKDLPSVIVNDKEYLFINGVGFGIDGYCCEVGDKLQAQSDKPVNYTSIAIKGLLFHYKRPNGKVIVDGVEHNYKKVWLAPTMKGKYYGGGMKVAPDQDRNDKERFVTTVIMHKSPKLKTLIVFPSIFKGEHVKHTEMIEVLKGHDITVEFDLPTSLQIDGETILGVTKYEVHAK